MADETKTDTTTGPANVPGGVMNLDPGTFPGKIVEGSPLPSDAIEPDMPVDEPLPAVDRLRAFEDEKLGKDTPRFAGAIERGSGSLYERMSADDQAMHGKLEKLVGTEARLAAAHTALIAADQEHDAALKAVEEHDG